MALSQVLRLFSLVPRGAARRDPSRRPLARGLGAFRLAAVALAVLMGGAASANGPSLVVDVESGRVLHADRATDPWYPASITKLMTVYVALDLARQGRVAMDQLLTVSEEAYALPPSKMAFKPGSQIRLDNALKIIMVKSANDVAATIAENLGGSVEGFAGLMNDTARRIGMRESHWVNPHGLPDDRQYTSARDMAILARALIRDFPDQADLFQIGAIRFGRRIMRNHNGLIGRYPGADGMKTGFICAGGFNVVATASRNGRRLITVVMGSSSANERTLKAAELFDLGFERSSTFNPSLEALPTSASLTPPNMRSVICDRRGPVPGEDDGGMAVAAGAETGTSLFGAPNLMAYAGGTLAPANRTVLGPRSPVQPINVWLGPNPPNATELKAQAEAEDAEEKARLDRKAKRGKAIAAKPAADDADADPKPKAAAAKSAPEKTEAKPKPVAAKPASAESAEAKPKPVSAKPAPAEDAEVKPAAKAAAKPAPRVAAKPDPAAKPASTAAAPKTAPEEGKAEAKASAKEKPAAKKPVKPEAKPQTEKPEARKAGAPKAASNDAAKPAPRS